MGLMVKEVVVVAVMVKSMVCVHKYLVLHMGSFCASQKCCSHSVVSDALLMIMFCVLRHQKTEAVSVWFDDCDAPASL